MHLFFPLLLRRSPRNNDGLGLCFLLLASSASFSFLLPGLPLTNARIMAHGEIRRIPGMESRARVSEKNPCRLLAGFSQAIAVSSRFRLAGDIYHERFARLELQAYAWYRNSALDLFYLFPQKTMLVSIRIQGVSHY